MDRTRFAGTSTRARVVSGPISRGSAAYVSRGSYWKSPNFLDSSVESKMRHAHKLIGVYQTILSGLVAGILLIGGGVGVWIYFHGKGATGPPPAAPITSPSLNGGGSVPASPNESPNSNVRTISGSDPYKLKIPSLGVDAFMQSVGIDAQGDIQAPNNGGWVGWYTKASKPGTGGLAILDGHINTYTGGAGAFRDLKKLASGDLFYIVLKNGTTYKYKVMNSQSVSTQKANALQYINKSPSPNRINLVTCDGSYDDATGQYDNRLIVQAEQIE